MKGKKLAAGILIVTMLAYGMSGWTAAAPITGIPVKDNSPHEKEEWAAATPSDAENTENTTLATPGDAQIKEKEDQDADAVVDKTTEKTGAIQAVNSAQSRAYGADGEYQLEAEDESIASFMAPDKLHDEKNRVELQQNGSVSFDLSKITDFQAGHYMLYANMNGNSTRIKVRINDQDAKEFEKENSGWDFADLKEYSYCWLELNPGDRLTIAEGAGEYTHLDWVKLSLLDADYWLDAEDSSVASYDGDVKTTDYTDRVEVNGGGSVSFDFSKVSGFKAGRYRLYAGANGARTQWGVSLDNQEIGNIEAPGNGKYQTGTCLDAGLGTEIELSETSLLKLSDIDGSWGHLDYIRLLYVEDTILPTPPVPPVQIEGGYQLEAEDETLASFAEPNVLNSEGNRVELQQNGSVSYDLSKISEFQAGNYMLIARMNGSSKRIRLLVDGSEKGRIIKAGVGFGDADLAEFYFHGILALNGTETITIQEGENQYTHLDWIKLLSVDSCYWVEAEDSTITTYSGGAKLKEDDQDRVEMDAGASVVFDFSKLDGFRSGRYALYAGVNGKRTNWKISIDDVTIGDLIAPGNEKFETGTCEDVKLGVEVELLETSKLQVIGKTDWGHLDYIRLIRTGDATPKFDVTHEATGIRVTAPQGYFPDKTVIETQTVPLSLRKEIRETFKNSDPEQKVFFYRFSLKMPKTEREYSAHEEDVIAYLPIPKGYSRDCDLYFARQPEDELELLTGTWTEGQKLCVPMEENGGIYVLADENIWKFEGEDYYTKTTDAGTAADLQPMEAIEFSIPEDEAFESGYYNLLLRVCGGQSYTILVNGKEATTVKRAGTYWGSYEVCAAENVLKLTRASTISLKADDHYGWVDYVCLKLAKPYEEETPEGIIVKAEIGVVPADAEFFAASADEEQMEDIREMFGFAEENAPAMNFYQFSLRLNDAEINPSGLMKIRIPVPEDFVSAARTKRRRSAYTESDLSLYQIKENNRKVRVSYRLVENGSYVEFETKEMGLYGLINQAPENEYSYFAADYYDRLTGDAGEYADLQPGDKITIPVKDFASFVDSNYLLSVYASGNRTKFMVLVNDVPVGMISREKTDWEQMNKGELPLVLSLTQEDVITIYAPGLADAGPFGWVDYVELKETSQAPAALPAAKTKITLEAEHFYPDELEADGMVANINNCAKKLEFPILATDGFAEDDYHFTLFTTGTMRNWAVCVNGIQVLTGSREGSGYEMRHMTKEIGSKLLHLKPGDILSVEFLEQDADNYGNWVDKIVLNSRRKIAGDDFFGRVGGRIPVEMAGKAETVKQVKTQVSEGKLIYQGEAYYRAQTDNPAADLQPGEQIRIPVSDHGQFSEGMYHLTVRSCGNREIFRIKVNGWTAGSITRKETGYGMNEMTDDRMGGTLSLKPGDVLIIEGQTGGKYGWVDYVALSRVSAQTENPGSILTKNYTWEGEDYYPKQKDYPAADLQPMEEIVIPLNTNAEFIGGSYYLAVKSNGNRTAMVIKKNGERIGSITRNETNFTMDSMTLDVLPRPITLLAGDVISIYAPGDESGPYGWVDQMILMPAETACPKAQEKEEYRYPAWAYGTASLYLPAADLQPEEALQIPLMDNTSFVEGQYRAAVISNGNRERFDLLVNGQPVGSIFRKPSDYGDNGMSSDKLEQILYLKPSDIVTIVGQEGDFYGWVSALVLEAMP